MLFLGTHVQSLSPSWEIPGTHIAVCNHLVTISRGPHALFRLQWAPGMHKVHIHDMSAKHPNIIIIILKIKCVKNNYVYISYRKVCKQYIKFEKVIIFGEGEDMRDVNRRL